MVKWARRANPIRPCRGKRKQNRASGGSAKAITTDAPEEWARVAWGVVAVRAAGRRGWQSCLRPNDTRAVRPNEFKWGEGQLLIDAGGGGGGGFTSTAIGGDAGAVGQGGSPAPGLGGGGGGGGTAMAGVPVGRARRESNALARATRGGLEARGVAAVAVAARMAKSKNSARSRGGWWRRLLRWRRRRVPLHELLAGIANLPRQWWRWRRFELCRTGPDREPTHEPSHITISYNPLPAPSVQIMTPSGALSMKRSDRHVNYACLDSAGAPGIETCEGTNLHTAPSTILWTPIANGGLLYTQEQGKSDSR